MIEIKTILEDELDINPEYLKLTGDEKIDYEELLKILTLRVQELIDKDFEKLLYILYRADVSEQSLTKALEGSSSDESASIIAEMYMRRQLKKIETRKKYSEDSTTNDWEFDI